MTDERASGPIHVCQCGLEIPPGADWEPQCRHCERILINRLFGFTELDLDLS